jgi:hypothetical protein
MRWPSAPLDTFETTPLGRWGIECFAGWRQLLDHLFERLEAAIAAQPVDQRDRYRAVQIKEKFGTLRVYLATEGTPEMAEAIRLASDESARTCEVCSEPGALAERGPAGLWATRCPTHETWTPHGGVGS